MSHRAALSEHRLGGLPLFASITRNAPNCSNTSCMACGRRVKCGIMATLFFLDEASRFDEQLALSSELFLSEPD